jgi:hypothetical protein
LSATAFYINKKEEDELKILEIRKSNCLGSNSTCVALDKSEFFFCKIKELVRVFLANIL